MININDIIGKTYNEWEVLEYDEFRIVGKDGKKIRRRHFYMCRCSCGEMRSVQRANLINSKSKSCGHKHRETFVESIFKHGLSRDRLFRIYNEMKRRCTNENAKDYINYGGRGILICNEWLNSFDSFKEWSIANGYNNKLSIDRINNDGNYEPSNCRWTTSKEQALNRRGNIIITAISPDGVQYSNITDIATFCKEYNLSSGKVYGCVNGDYKTHKGWKFYKQHVDKH